MPEIAAGSVIHPNVRLGEGARIGPFVVLGEPPRHAAPGELETVIGANCIVRSHSVIYAGNHIGDEFQTGHGVLLRESNQVGSQVSVGSHSIIEHHVTIGDRVRIHSNCFIPEYCILEEDCWIGPAVVMTNADYPRSAGVKESLKGAIVRKGARIGAGVVLLPGVTIGAEALIGAGAVVVVDVEPGGVVVGNPARLIKHVSDIPEYRRQERK